MLIHYLNILIASLHQSNSVFALGAAAFLGFLLMVVTDITPLLIIDWLLATLAEFVFWKRKQVPIVRVFDAATGAPLVGVLVTVEGVEAQSVVSDPHGRVFMSFPEGNLNARLTKKGYHAQELTITPDLKMVSLEPLYAVESQVSILFLFGVWLRNSLKYLQVFLLLAGTILLVITLVKYNSLSSLSLLFYAGLWLSYFLYRSRGYQLVRVVRATTREPLRQVTVIGYRRGKRSEFRTDEHGYCKLYYPLPDSIVLRKNNYKTTEVKNIMPHLEPIEYRLLPQEV